MPAVLCRLMMAALMLLGLQAPALAQQAGGKNIAVSLLTGAKKVPAGGAIPIAFMMKPKPTWHGYWKNPGDAGAEATIAWDLPPGVSVGDLRYPLPGRLVVSGIMNYVYEHDYALLAELKLAGDVAPGTPLPLKAKLDYLACTDEICVPESAELSAEIVAGAAGNAVVRDARFDAFEAAMPKPLGADGRFVVENGRVRIGVPLPAAMVVIDPYFFPLEYGALDHGAVQTVSRNGDMLIVETQAGSNAAGLAKIDGLLKIGEGQGLSLTATPGTVPPAGDPIGTAGAEGAGGIGVILAALGGAILGGLLLNIMPCVFPILSLKALSLAKAGGDEMAARREALAYTAGVVLVCLALGGVLLGLRAGGAAVGWAFQLQDPRVILILLLLVTGIALNLAGLFELPAISGGSKLASAGGAQGAFWTGALAAFVATPCTGPFMGAALGAALVLPTAAALAIFAGLGLGLALPFLLLGFLPALRRRLPKPGAWMERLRRILSIPMFLTALGLAWILGRQAGVDAMALGIGAALLLAFGLWWVGIRQGRPRAWLPLAPALAAGLAAILIVPLEMPAQARVQGVLQSEPFSEAKLAALRGEQRPVFVYFTADWCITCKVNEKGVLSRADVAQGFKSRNIAVLVGDWTRGDAAIGRFLAQHGRSGVPLYLYYAPGRDAEILPQILTVGDMAALGR
ncbi:protein-disulfide reductase DsbD family protein [Allosphingosinicella vermicomposti]|uniref:protein-disulfide reductase DsbD family protein n=1 Tax=Allosphingosinicella vermicomposti TaxID=614671 RepID=UPI000D0FB7D3|nr:thioredoxin family protein [Allosphingosinicella vermicomposti]